MSLAGYADIFLRNTLYSGVVPQISAIMGPCAGGAVYSPAITDFVLMVDKTSYMFITGPDVIKTVTHEEVTKEQLGGAMTHNETSGVAHFLAHDDAECLSMVRELLSFVPSNNLDDPPRKPCTDPIDRADAALDTIVPAQSNLPYDMKDVIHAVVDDGYFFEVQEHYAKNIVVGFARLDGRSVGIVANQSGNAGGHARHQRLDQGRALRSLLRLLQHSAGHLRRRPRISPRHRAGIRRHHQARRQAALRLRRSHGAEGHGDHAQSLRRRLLRDGLQAHPHRCELRVAYGGDRSHGPGRRGGHRLQARTGGRGEAAENRRSVRQKKIEEFRDRFASPYVAADRGFVDAIIQPRETRKKLIQALAMLENKRDKNPPKKHGNIPL